MRERQDLTGQVFGKLTVVEYVYTDKHRRSRWLCKCLCDKETIVASNQLKNGTTKSCGCSKYEHNYIDITGQKFGRLLVIEYSYTKNKKPYWLCKCDCGKQIIVRGASLKNGLTQSCGCLQKEQVSGENSVRWRGGASKQKYPKEWTEKLKKEIRNRDRHKCQFQDCNYDDTKEKRKLDVHHIDSNKNNCELSNLICLCPKHHRRVENSNPSLWIDYFYQITRDYQTI